MTSEEAFWVVASSSYMLDTSVSYARAHIQDFTPDSNELILNHEGNVQYFRNAQLQSEELEAVIDYAQATGTSACISDL